ncbi:MAG: mechanosensitive ion channel family protein [Nanoarchaeota archaeon]|nr:mechanosensitive ion channel family protein [Nanoarchaeota archaeon]
MLENLIVNDYLRFVILLVGGFIVLRVFVWIIQKVFAKLTEKTKTDLDDLILKKTSKPLTFLVFVIVLRVAIEELTFGANMDDIINKALFSLIIVGIFLVVYAIFFLVINRGWKKISEKNRSKGKNEGLFHLLMGTLKVVFVIAIFLVILNYWGVEIGPLLAGIGIGGIAIAFALQSSLSNVFGGVSIILDESVRVGDLVTLSDGPTGQIMKIGLRSTKIKTFDNEVIIVPNGKLADSNIHNIAQPEPKSRVVIPFGVAYGSDIEKVKKVVLAEIKKVENFIEEPAPSVRFLEMADSSLNFKAYFFVNSFENRFAAIDEANTRIYNALNKAKIEIPFPQMDVHVKK